MPSINQTELTSWARQAATLIEIPPDEAVNIVKSLLQSAALSSDLTSTLTVKLITTSPDEKESKHARDVCLVKGEICLPFIGCFCVCIIPPGFAC